MSPKLKKILEKILFTLVALFMIGGALSPMFTKVSLTDITIMLLMEGD